jgi:hypothetical protein
VIFIVRQLSFHELIAPRLAVIGEIKEMNYVMLLFLYRLPAKVNNLSQPKGFMIRFPAMSNKDGVRGRKRTELEFCGVLNER